ncbi:MAG TPA: oligosaccharide flippase family protein, partial [Defluviitoga tunisiensis]|nr:oligosaccharide flippase family protein [Defluviitoga tunisiensis]
MKSKVVKAGTWYTLTNFFTIGISFLTLPIFTRLLSTEDYGITSVYSSYLNIFVIVFSLDVVASIQRGKFDFKDNYNQFVSSVLFLGTISFIIFSLLILAFQSFFSKMLDLEPILLYVLLINAFFAFVQNLVLAKFRVEYNYKKISLIQIANSLIGVILSIILITRFFTNTKYLGRILGSSLPVIISGFILLLYIFTQGKEIINKIYWKYALIISVPLILHNLAGIINAQFDRIFINKYIGSSEAGIYSFAYNVGMIIDVLWVSTNQAWVPWFYERMDANNYSAIRKRAKNFRDFFTLAYILILFVSPEIIKVMADKRYWDGLVIVPYIFMAYYFNLMYSFEVNVEFYTRKTHLISIGTILGAVINVVLNIVLIPKYGYVIAAVTTVISNFFLFVFHFIIVNYLLRIRIFGIRFHLVSLSYVVIATTVFMVFQNYLLMRISVLVLGTIC